MLVQVMMILCLLANTRDLRNMTHLVDGSTCVACRLLIAIELLVPQVGRQGLVVTLKCLKVCGVRGCHRRDQLRVVTELGNLRRKFSTLVFGARPILVQPCIRIEEVRVQVGQIRDAICPYRLLICRRSHL